MSLAPPAKDMHVFGMSLACLWDVFGAAGQRHCYIRYVFGMSLACLWRVFRMSSAWLWRAPAMCASRAREHAYVLYVRRLMRKGAASRRLRRGAASRRLLCCRCFDASVICFGSGCVDFRFADFAVSCLFLRGRARRTKLRNLQRPRESRGFAGEPMAETARAARRAAQRGEQRGTRGEPGAARQPKGCGRHAQSP